MNNGRKPSDPANTAPADQRRADTGGWSWAQFVRTLRLSLLAMLAFWLLGMAILLWIRRAQGAMTSPPTWGVGLAAGLLLAGVAALLRWLPRPWPGEDSQDSAGLPAPPSESVLVNFLTRLSAWAQIPSLLLVLPGVAAVLFALAISLPGSSTPGLIALWVLLAVEETHAWMRLARREPSRPSLASPPVNFTSAADTAFKPEDSIEPKQSCDLDSSTEITSKAASGTQGTSSNHLDTWAKPVSSPTDNSTSNGRDHSNSVAADPDSDSEADQSSHFFPAVLSEELPAEVDQQWSRATLPDGTQTIQGLVRARLAAGQRTVSVHLAFCPPLQGEPELEFEQVDGPEARIQLGTLLGHGARLDVRLLQAEPAATAVLIEFAVQAASEPA